MARSKRYAERVNILKKVRVGGVGNSLPFSNETARSSATTFSLLASMSTMRKEATTWSGIRRESEDAKRLATSRKFSKPHAASRSR